MKTIFSTIIITVLTLFLSGCNDYLDINKDPDALSEIPEVKVLLPAAEVGIGNNLMGWDFGFGSAFWVEYWTQSYTASQFKAFCEYQPEDFGTAYQSLMAQPLADLNRIITLTKNDEEQIAYYYIAEALSIFTWQVVTDVWGDMPYFEALKGNEGILHPKQDAGKDIYADLLARVDALLALDLSNANVVESKYDFIYAGDMESWTQFAAALKVKLLIRQSETSSYNNAEVLSFIESTNLLTSSAKIPGTIWDDDNEGKRHPMREFEAGGANYLSTNVIACKSFFDYLSVNSDPRLATLFSGTKAAFFGDFDSKYDSDGNGITDDKETYAKVVFGTKMDIMLISEWEINFYIAEVYARAGDHANAKLYFENGVKASLTQHGITTDNIITGTGYAVWVDGNVESEIKQIAMQKWVANCNYQHIQSFLERNRTKYPSVNDVDVASKRRETYLNFPVGDLTISVNGRARLNGNLPSSPLYPETYIFRNNNAPSQKVNIGQKVWWDLKAGK